MALCELSSIPILPPTERERARERARERESARERERARARERARETPPAPLLQSCHPCAGSCGPPKRALPKQSVLSPKARPALIVAEGSMTEYLFSPVCAHATQSSAPMSTCQGARVSQTFSGSECSGHRSDCTPACTLTRRLGQAKRPIPLSLSLLSQTPNCAKER
jgi:hypothetical protein